MTSISRGRASAPLWGALLLGSGAWSLHLIVSHFLVEAVCAQVAAAGGSAEVSVWLPLLIVTAVAAGLALAGAVFAWSRRRVLERRGPGLERAAGLSTVVASLSLFFVLVILLESAPLLMIGCGAS
ncbi:MAG: hypothetical protein WD273_12485 [Trueperaceae bacterium]